MQQERLIDRLNGVADDHGMTLRVMAIVGGKVDQNSLSMSVKIALTA